MKKLLQKQQKIIAIILQKDYREAISAFYEINSIMPIKKIFIEQYHFAAQNCAIK